MEPDNIIQQKEWSELDAAERAALREIAADEQEFNMLKKMLLIAAAEDVPKLDAGIKERLNDRLQRGNTRRMNPWYYAAAAMLVLAAITWLLVQRTPEVPTQASNDKPKKDTVTIGDNAAGSFEKRHAGDKPGGKDGTGKKAR
jgi:hypothetical protein